MVLFGRCTDFLAWDMNSSDWFGLYDFYIDWHHMSIMWLWLFDSFFSLIAHSGSSSNAKYDPDQIKAEIACRRERVGHYPQRTMPHTSGPRGGRDPSCVVLSVCFYVCAEGRCAPLGRRGLGLASLQCLSRTEFVRPLWISAVLQEESMCQTAGLWMINTTSKSVVLKE